MDSEYNELSGFRSIPLEEVELGGTKRLLDSLPHRTDFSVLAVLCGTSQTGKKCEAILVEVVLDGVPSRNRAGIRYKERLALLYESDSSKLPRVLALRKDFPLTLHVNRDELSGGCALCLYFESTASVKRTWTPANFLSRIVWWLEETAKGSLHPSDQPLEQLFFESPWELIVPSNFDEIRRSSGTKLSICRVVQRPDSTQSFFLGTSDSEPTNRPVVLIDLQLSSVVQGHVEDTPLRLGALYDLLDGRGVDLLKPLRIGLHESLPAKGAVEDPKGDLAILLLHVPVSRAAGSGPERTRHHAFLMPNRLKVGESVGAYFFQKTDQRHYRAGHIGEPPLQDGWRDHAICPMHLLRFPTKEESRLQSAIGAAGPVGLLVGVGALGSSLLNAWSRAGWGSWSVVDNDHLRPHNLTRHRALSSQVGQMKARAAATICSSASDFAITIKAIEGDGVDLEKAEYREMQDGAELVVDATAGVDYPRFAGSSAGLARHVSAFITPNGSGAVLLAEDSARSISLLALEAQYYRALLNCDWGEHHLDRPDLSFWSGGSCRDISIALDGARVDFFAGLLAEEVRHAVADAKATIRVWTRSEGGALSSFASSAFSAREFKCGDLRVLLDDGLLAELRKLRASSLPAETGGVLVGYIDLSVGCVAVVDSLPAPSDSESSPSFFERGCSGLADVVKEVSRKTGGMVQYIGEWHSHPSGYSASASSTDILQLAQLSAQMSADGLPVVCLIVAEGDAQVHLGQAL